MIKTLSLRVGLISLAAILFTAEGERVMANPATEPGASAEDWPMHGRTASEQRFSPLTQIDDANAGRLGLAWYHEFDTDRGQEATPIEVGGVIYVSTAWSKVFAFDAVSGKPRWSYDPEVPGKTGFNACCDVVNRGVAVSDGRVFVATLDGRLIAIDANTGKPLWSVMTVDPSKPYTSSGAPRVAKGKVIIGNSGSEYGIRGYVSAYDAATGKQAWRFYTVPGDPAKGPDGAASDPMMAMASATWHGHWYDYGGGGTVYDSIVYDPELDQLYIGTGNGAPFDYKVRSDGKGDNLFLASIVALNPDTGAYLWHYQLNPGEAWDYDATQPIMLADLTIGGQARKVLMQAPKNGFFYVIDRRTGRLISADPYSQQSWAKGIDLATGRPIENPDLRYDGKPALVTPGTVGGHNWHPMAYSPKTGLVYIPTQQNAAGYYAAEKPFKFKKGDWNTGIDFIAAGLPDDSKEIRKIATGMTGALVAWDPIARKIRWSVEQPYQRSGGTLATAGNLVFQGRADGTFSAYGADNGRELWNYGAGNGIVAGPISYEIDHVQYIAVMAGFGGNVIGSGFQFPQHERLPGRLLVLRLDGKAIAPAYDIPAKVPLDVPTIPKAEIAKRGEVVFAQICMVCHGVSAIGATLPDLRYSPAILDSAIFDSVLIDGALERNGMISFRDKVSAADIEAVRAYLLSRARAAAEDAKYKARR